MKIDNIANKLAQKQIEKTQNLAMSGDLLSAFFSTRDFCNRIPDCPIKLYDFQMELADVLKNENLAFDVACKEMDIYHRMPVFDFGKTFQYLSLSLLKLDKIPQLKRFLRTFHLEKQFATFKNVKDLGIDKATWGNFKEPSLFDKINISTMSLWIKYERAGRLEEIADSKVDIKKEGKYYFDLRFKRAQAMIGLNRIDNAIEYIKSAGTQYNDKDIFCLITAYDAQKDDNAIDFYTRRLIALAKKNKIDNEYISTYLNYYDSHCKWQSLYDLCKAYLVFHPIDHLTLLYNAFASYNLGMIDECKDLMIKVLTIYPYCTLPIRILEYSIELGAKDVKYNAPCPAEVEQSFRLNYQHLLDILADKKAISSFMANKTKWSDFVCFISYMKAVSDQNQLSDILRADDRFELLYKELLCQQSLTLSAKLPLLYSYIQYARRRDFLLEANHFIYIGDLYDSDKISHYGQHFSNICANTLCYLLSLPANIEVFVPLYNFCVDLFSKQIISNNISLLENESAICGIIINLYLLLTFSQFPDDILIDNLGIKKQDIMAFNYYGADFGLKIVDRSLYINEQEVNIIELFQSTLGKNSSIKLSEK